MIMPVPGQVVQGVADESLVTRPHRILHINSARGKVVLIPAEPQRSKGKHDNPRAYFTRYRDYDLSEFVDQLNAEVPWLEIIDLPLRPVTAMSDYELNLRFPPKANSEGETTSDCSAVACRKQRWALIGPLVTSPEAALLFDPERLQMEVAGRATELSESSDDVPRICRQIREALYQYWAEGSTRGALTPSYDRCGARGKTRHAGERKRGAPNAATAAGLAGNEGFIPKAEDIDTMQFGWRNFLVRGTTVDKAYRKLIREFYAERDASTGDSDGERWLSRNERPTLAQFRYWGPSTDPGQSAWQKQLSYAGYERDFRPHGGSARDGVFAVCQRANVDSTSTDVVLVSRQNRLRRIGSATRILVRDSAFGYIPGFYLGLMPACASSVGLAFLHATSDKAQWLADLGLSDIPAADWIPMAFSEAASDNTDLRCTEVWSLLNEIGTSLMHVPTYRSDLNGLAEAGHHILHRLVDHNLYGTTHGRMKARGEPKPDLSACHTVLEAIRETARAVHYHNTVLLDPSVLTLAMRDDGVRPTRLDMTRWAIEHGYVARTLVDVEAARVHLLPVCTGTFTEDGVHLLRPDSGNKREYIAGLRWVSTDGYVIGQMEAARRGGRRRSEDFDAELWCDPFNLRYIWARNPYTLEILRLELNTPDRDFVFEATFIDALDIQDSDKVERYFTSDEIQQTRSSLEAKQNETKREARAAYDADLSNLDHAPSNAELCANKRENREQEVRESVFGMPVPDELSIDPGQHEGAPEEESEPSRSEPNPASPGKDEQFGNLCDEAVFRHEQEEA